MTDATEHAAIAAVRTVLRAQIASLRDEAGLPDRPDDLPSRADAILRAAQAAAGSDPSTPVQEPRGVCARLSETLAATASEDGALPAGVPEEVIAALRADLAAGCDPWATSADGPEPCRTCSSGPSQQTPLLSPRRAR